MTQRWPEDCASMDPGFEPCADEDCGGHLTSRRGRVECSHCERTPEEIEEEKAENEDESNGEEE